MPSSRPLMLKRGERIADRFLIVRTVAQGGMGAVFEAMDERLGRPVALKTIRPELVRDSAIATRFEREARAAAALNHPGIVQVYDLDMTSGGVAFIVMEWMEGRSLYTMVREEGKMAPDRAAGLVEQALRALAIAHGAGVVHRDLKPGNLMVVDLGGIEMVKVVDFGVAQLKQSTEFSRLTTTGQIIGTPAYMPPEQLRGEPVGPRADIYSMAMVLWTLLTGQRPFAADGDVVLAVLNTTPPRVDALVPEIPRALADIVARGIEKDASARFSSVREMAEALADFVTKIDETELSPLEDLIALGLLEPDSTQSSPQAAARPTTASAPNPIRASAPTPAIARTAALPISALPVASKAVASKAVASHPVASHPASWVPNGSSPVTAPGPSDRGPNLRIVGASIAALAILALLGLVAFALAWSVFGGLNP